MGYYNLTIHQKIGLKHAFRTDEAFKNYLIVWAVWDYKSAIDYFLTGDLSVIPNGFKECFNF